MKFETFKKDFEKVPVESHFYDAQNEPIVSICIQTYQHAKYIRQCLDSILNQQCNFNFEILLGEDFSNDGTREICIEYAQQHPDKIRLFLHHRQNNIAIGGTPTGRFNFLYNIFSSRGKYIALCEGDDYWIDPLKLQRQVTLLEKNEQYVLSAENSMIVNSFSGTEYRFSEVHGIKEYGIEDLLRGRKFHTASVIFRKEALQLPSNIAEYPFGDTILFLSLAKVGGIHYNGQVSSVYRRHEGGMTGINKWRWVQNVEQFNNMVDDFTEGKFRHHIQVNILNEYYSAFKFYAKKGNVLRAMHSFVKCLAISPLLVLKKIVRDLSFRK